MADRCQDCQRRSTPRRDLRVAEQSRDPEVRELRRQLAELELRLEERIRTLAAQRRFRAALAAGGLSVTVESGGGLTISPTSAPTPAPPERSAAIRCFLGDNPSWPF